MISKDPDQENKVYLLVRTDHGGEECRDHGIPRALSRYLEQLPGYRHVEGARYGGVCILKIASRIQQLQVMGPGD